MQAASLQGRVGHGKISYVLEFRSRLVLEKSRHECSKYPPDIIHSYSLFIPMLYFRTHNYTIRIMLVKTKLNKFIKPILIAIQISTKLDHEYHS